MKSINFPEKTLEMINILTEIDQSVKKVNRFNRLRNLFG